jgi:hypothetical protein
MKPVLLDLELLEPGCVPTLVTSPNTELVDDLPAAVTPDGVIVSRWRLSPEERAAVAAGADLYVFQWRGSMPALQPIGLTIGPGGPITDQETTT